MVTAVRQLGADGGLSSYRLRIQPALALLAYRRTCRIFQEESVPDIVAQIVQEHRASNPDRRQLPPGPAAAPATSPKLRTAMRTRKSM
ncbi:phage late control D family protein [Xanthomonas oryzae]|uniref:phage late control D family protein n=1 Tax=Xanthomonas oryzae TaxID=347 RepID=UPI0023688F5F|nr:phage late control D family protein [Xanthomonas oryzae]WDN21937.1 phage late control D family protein [Xanthomonas oryzae]